MLLIYLMAFCKDLFESFSLVIGYLAFKYGSISVFIFLSINISSSALMSYLSASLEIFLRILSEA